MRSKILDYIDFGKVDALLEGFSKSTGFVTAILDLDGNVLSRSGWREICTEYHRIHPESLANCRVSDTVQAGKLPEGGKYHSYKCLNGLVDVAAPIIIKGEHIANLFSGQFLYEKPDIEYFKKQALKYGFDEKTYLEALKDVPVVSQKSIESTIDFLLTMTQVIIEMTNQKLEQTELVENIRESEERFRLTLDNMKEGCQIIGFDWCFIYINDSAERHNRRSREDFLGNNYTEIWPGIEKTVVFDLIKDCMDERIPHQFENEFTFPDGVIGWFDLSIQPVREGVFILSIDITERKMAEKSLRESERRYRDMLSNIELIAMTLDREGRITFCNDYMLMLTGWKREEIQGANWFDLFIPTDDEEIRNVFKDLLEDKPQAWHNENEILTRYGERRYIRWNNMALRSPSGEVTGTASIGEDNTERRQAEIRINEQLNELRRGYEALVEREGRIIEIKQEVNELLSRSGEPPRYRDLTREDMA